MRDRIPTTYRELLVRLCDEGLLAPAEEKRVRRLLESGSPEVLAFAAHEVVRHLIRTGRLALRTGSLSQPGTALVAADERRGLLITLPALTGPHHGFLRPPLDPSVGPQPDFSSDEILRLIRHESLVTLSSVERSADIKAVVTGILDLCRELLGASAALFLTDSLPVPGGIARGSRAAVFGARATTGSLPTGHLPRAWAHWVADAGQHPGQALYLPDFALLAAEQRPLAEGSALLLQLAADDPAWEGTLVLVATRPYAFAEQQLARLRILTPYFAAQLAFAVRVQKAVSVDYLTATYNRAFFVDQFARTIDGARRKQQRCALLIIDIDDFRSFNSKHGYDAGDEVLRSVARAMERVLRTTDVLARYGGEEFAVILAPDLSAAEAAQIGERLRSAVAELRIEVDSLSGGPRIVQATVSIGGALFPTDGTSRTELWSQANRMLLEVKGSGKDAVRFPRRD